ncbi:MAG: hypothetical protein LBT55_04945 [Clostridiaceae bacterium]|jgi:hypothetical protein|nr:hypothetical protein [Clostridiaceae bacterium]
MKRKGLRKQIFFNSIGEFVHDNKKLCIIVTLLFTVGLIAGISATASGGVEAIEYKIGAGAVFAKALLVLLACYVLVLFSGINGFFTVLAFAAIAGLGARLGYDVVILIGGCGAKGVLNFIFVYLILYLVSVVMLTVAMAVCLPYRGVMECRRVFGGLLRRVGLIFFVNVIAALIVIFLIGSFCRVIII